jgi:predicted ATP-dependent endonuclease of OLD family
MIFYCTFAPLLIVKNKNMILKKIKLHNWKNFQNCEVNLEERCFIIGANASGKSNFIDALRFLRDISKQAGGLQNAVLLLQNTQEGTVIHKISDIAEIKPIIEAGLSIADAVIPYTKPKEIEKLIQLAVPF